MTINFSEIMTVDIESYDPNLDKLGPGVYRKDGNVLGVAVSKPGVIREYLDLGHPNLPESGKLYNLRRLRDLMADPCPKLGANFGYDLDWIVNGLGIPVKGIKHDIQIAEPLLNAYRRSYSLDSLSVDYLGEHKKDDEILLWCRKHGLIKENDDKTAPQKFLYLMPFELVSRYALSDIDQTARIFEQQWPQIVEQELVQVYEMESELLDIFCMMRKNGIRIDTEKQTKLIYTLDDYIKEQSRALYKEYGKFNYNSSKQLADLFDILQIGYNKTEKGNPSIKNEDLDAIDHPIGRTLRQVRKAEKVLNTFVNGSFIDYNAANRIHCNFFALRGDGFGTVTGRMSCLAGDSRVSTPSGPKEIKNMKAGDLVYTHTGKTAKVKQLIFQGEKLAYRLTTEQNTDIICTKDHLFWSGSWQQINNCKEVLYVGEEGNSYGRLVDRNNTGNVSIGRKTNHKRRCKKTWGNLSQHSIRVETQTYARTKRIREAFALVSGQNTTAKSHEREEIRETSQLERCGVRQQRVFDYKTRERETCFCSSPCNGRSFRGSYRTTGEIRRTSYRRKRREQRHRQFSACDKIRTHKITPRMVQIKGLAFVGKIPVFDIEVDHKDHSFIANGYAVHNCQDPNMQQVPHPIDPKDTADIGFDFGKACRELFIPEIGHDFGKDDFSQIEYRFIAHYARGPRADEIRDRYNQDPDTDYHQFVMDLTGVDRTTAKRLNFGMAYYMGAKSMAKKFGWTIERSMQLVETYFKEVPFMIPTRETVVQTAKTRGYIRTIYGRRARVSEEHKREKREYALFNYLIQGSAADLTKKALVDSYKKGLFDILKLHLVVHDELCVSVPQSVEGIQAYREMKETMQNAIKLKVPVMSEAQIGPSWGEGDKIYEKEGTDKKSGKRLLTWAELEKRYL